MCHIYVDDVRECPNGFIKFQTVNHCLDYIRHMYKMGNMFFYLDLDHDASDEYASDGGDYINILKNLEAMRHGGHLKNAHFQCHFHSGNAVGIQNMRAIVEANYPWMIEV